MEPIKRWDKVRGDYRCGGRPKGCWVAGNPRYSKSRGNFRGGRASDRRALVKELQASAGA